MSSNDDLMVFKPDPAGNTTHAEQHRPWRVLIVDDEPEVHMITTLVLKDFVFETGRLEFHHAYSSQEARTLLLEKRSMAVILLDVVMETDNAGLELVHWIRTVLKDDLVRIILRTGQPGAAPEKQVITRYDINDYKEKTELTDTKLWTSMTVALRGYRDLSIITRSKRGLEKIVHASVMFSERQSLTRFLEGVLTQLTSLLDAEEDSLLVRSDAFAVHGHHNNLRIISATGAFAPLVGKPLDELQDLGLVRRIRTAYENRESQFQDNYFVGYMGNDDGAANLVLLQSPMVLGEAEREIIKVFTSNAGLALSNVSLGNAVEDTQNEMIFTLGEVVESRSIETGYHVRRVAAIADLLAGKLGMNDREREALRMAVPLHDIGKIGIPDRILNKPSSLNEDELAEMRKHTLIGYNLLRGGSNHTLQLAATVALTHHERWDGLGYPQRLEGDSIPLCGRLTCVADVFDALLHDRVYKPAWQADAVLQYLSDNSGTQFDPDIIKVMNDSIDAIFGIINQFKEPI